MIADKIQQELAALGNAEIAAHSQKFFKTGPGEYGEGDTFRGIRVPALRKLARRHYRALAQEDILRLLTSDFHEDRLLALLIMVHVYDRGDAQMRQQIYDAYLHHTRWINNWDLVDASAHKILGPHLERRNRDILYRLAGSALLWERRIAVMATFHFIRLGEYDDTLTLAATLLNDEEDLIHKIVGWMLREVGNRAMGVEESFLQQYYQKMPRTMLRYAIERFPESRRQAYLKGLV